MNATKTTTDAVDVTRRDGQWVCYQTTESFAFEMFNSQSLDECREWARCAGFDGIVIGSPSRPWGN